ncbi:MAG: hypothetical protein HC786_29515 [Richelia sp. CSU_2_1]|nr:hypothetical protein [Richelia sp. CSU_2_1]
MAPTYTRRQFLWLCSIDLNRSQDRSSKPAVKGHNSVVSLQAISIVPSVGKRHCRVRQLNLEFDRNNK